MTRRRRECQKIGKKYDTICEQPGKEGAGKKVGYNTYHKCTRSTYQIQKKTIENPNYGNF